MEGRRVISVPAGDGIRKERDRSSWWEWVGGKNAENEEEFLFTVVLVNFRSYGKIWATFNHPTEPFPYLLPGSSVKENCVKTRNNSAGLRNHLRVLFSFNNYHPITKPFNIISHSPGTSDDIIILMCNDTVYFFFSPGNLNLFTIHIVSLGTDTKYFWT